MFFQLFSTIKVNIVDEMMQSAYLYVISYVKHKKITIMAILTWFLILDKIQDGDHCWPRHRPPAAPPPIKCVYLILLRRSRLSTKGKIVSKYFNISNTLGRSSIHPPPRLYHGGGMNLRLRVRPRVNLVNLHMQKIFCFTVFLTGHPM